MWCGAHMEYHQDVRHGLVTTSRVAKLQYRVGRSSDPCVLGTALVGPQATSTPDCDACVLRSANHYIRLVHALHDNQHLWQRMLCTPRVSTQVATVAAAISHQPLITDINH
jgi:hypothetical protein